MKAPVFLQNLWSKLVGAAEQSATDKPARELTKWQKDKLEKIKEAYRVLKAPAKTIKEEDLVRLHKALQTKDQLSYAIKILNRKIKDYPGKTERLKLKDYQQLAKYTYKDTSLQSAVKYDAALKILIENCDLADSVDTETLGLAGSIYKRKFYFDSQFKNLEMSLYYYKKGYESWLKWLDDMTRSQYDIDGLNDDGYTAINYAYVAELIGIKKLEQWRGIRDFDLSVFKYFEIADKVRKEILDAFDKLEKGPRKWKAESWLAATKAEANFGRRKYAEAYDAITAAKASMNDEPWTLRTFSQQMLSLAQAQEFLLNYGKSDNLSDAVKNQLELLKAGIEHKEIERCIRSLMDNASNSPSKNAGNALITQFGKTGLALSGGGFRASLFHIGVLAALAEEDKLKNIEVISCVSGGSIIGAYYYLELKNLLENNADENITSECYVKIVRKIEGEFLAGIQQNLRARIFTSFFRNLKMLSDSKNYSRTNRIGELYEEFLYSKIFMKTGSTTVNGAGGNIFMRDLIIEPFGQPDFVIQHDNWRRTNRIPQLVLNATSVNTGHNFQFTASWMGEPPDIQLSNIDVKPRLRRMYYDEAPEQRYQEFRLGYAVGASSCVPVIFDPLPMYDLYEGVKLQLIDGGLHDNQGIASLIDQECTAFIISDGSGQMNVIDKPTNNPASVFYRADSILQERLRELQFTDVLARNFSGQINPLCKMHLKRDLNENDIDWVGCKDPETREPRREFTTYGVPTPIEEKLSNLRTDLDSFNDNEAYGLMYAAYRQTKAEYGPALDPNKPITTGWSFAKFYHQLSTSESKKKTESKLAIGGNLLFKVFLMFRGIKPITWVLGLALLVWVTYCCCRSHACISLMCFVTIADAIIASYCFGMFLDWIGADFPKSVKSFERVIVWVKIPIMVFPALLLWLLSKFALYTLNPIYNRMGKIG